MTATIERFAAWNSWLLVSFLCLCLPLPVHALDPSKELTQYSYSVWTAADGLPQNSVRTLAQGPKGYLWIGTYEGLTLFDGVRMRPFIPAFPESPKPSRNISKILVAKDGGIWVATIGNGVFRIAPDWSTRQWTTKHGLYSNQINDLFQTEDGDLLVAGQSGVNRIHQDHVQNLPGIDATNNPVQSVFLDSQGTVWLGFRSQGLAAWRNGHRLSRPDLDVLAHSRVEAIIDDAAGGLWAGLLEGGLAHISDQGVDVIRAGNGLVSDDVLRLYRDHHGALWIGTYGFGLQRLYKGQFSSIDSTHGLSNPYVLSLIIDREGTLWFGTSGGLNQLRDGKFRNWSISEGLAGNYARSVVEDTLGTVWVGLDGGGLTPIRNGRVGHRLTMRDGLLSNRIRAIWPNPDASLWIAAYNGDVNRVKNDQVVAAWGPAQGLPSKGVRTLYGGQSGALWIGAESGGVTRLFENRIEHFALSGPPIANDIRAYAEFQGQLWVGTYGAGIFVLDGHDIIARYTHAQGLPSNVVFTFYVDMYGHFWAGTDSGIARLVQDRFATLDPVPTGGAVFQILGDDSHRLWLCTNAGILRFTPREQKVRQTRVIAVREVVHYGHEDGMRAAQCNGATQPAAWRTRQGTLWFPTIDGVTNIDPAHIPKNPVLPLPRIEDLLVDRKFVPLRGSNEVQLPPGRHDIQINYSGLSLVAPKKNQFQIRLLGLQEEWESVGNRRSAYFTQLEHGHYRFELRTANNDGLWNPRITGIGFFIRPYLYETVAFQGFVALLILVLIFSTYRLRVTHLHHAKTELEARVHERTRQLEIKAREAAEATQAKSDFLSHISHEIRTPLTAIIGFTERLLDLGKREPGATEQLQIVLHNAQHLNALVNDFLDLSKIEAGKMEIVAEAVPLAPLLSELQSMYSVMAKPRGLNFTLHADFPIPSVLHADTIRLKQILLNLLNNAVKFTQQGHVSLKVAWDRKVERVQFKVEDTGIGVPKEQQHLLFQNFSQADSGVTREYGGTGLGLVISRHLARAMGGDLGFHSTPGIGSTFTLTLPVGAEPDDFLTRPEDIEAVPWSEPASTDAIRIRGRLLVAEDNPTNQELIQLMLEGTGIDITVVEDGGEALASATTGEFDLILMDMHMPHMDGLEATRLIRDHDPDIPIIAVTADVMPQHVAEQEAAGCNFTLAKPIDRTALLEALLRYLTPA